MLGTRSAAEMSRHAINPRTRQEKAARRRADNRRQMECFRLSRLVPLIRSLAISREQREWRIRLIIGPDDRSLTGILMGDPRHERSMLFFKRMHVA